MKKLTTLERNWILYDVGNSAYTLLITTIIPIYFNSLATAANVSSVDYLAYWGYAASITTLIVAISGPLVGTLSDRKGSKKIIFKLALFIGALGCILMGFAKQWLVFLIVFIISKVFYQIGNIIYDSMLADVTTEDRVDIISAQGYAWGYIGSCIPFVVCLIFILGGGYVGIPMSFAMFLSLLITAVWWVGCTVPLFKTYKQINYNNKMTNPFSQLLQTIKGVRQHKKIFFFLIAFFFYIDGVYTIIDMATAYGSTLGLGTTDLLLALLVTQIVAFPSAIIIGQLSRKIAPEKIISVCIVAYTLIAIYAIFLRKPWQFWVLAISVGLFQGGIQALSRSYYTKIIPVSQSGEFFGIMDIIGKGASFTGTTVVGVMSQLTHSANLGVGSIAFFFVIGLIFFRMSASYR